MKYYQPAYYHSFKCIASKCKDTCCRHWQVDLDNDSYALYKTFIKSKEDIGRQLKNSIGGIGHHYIKNKTDGCCFFLNDSNLCDLQIALGHDRLPRTCRLYPRFFNTYGGYEERGLSFSCPEAARLIANNKQARIIIENDEPITELTSVDGELFKSIKTLRDKLLNHINEYCGAPEFLISAFFRFAYNVQLNLDSKNLTMALDTPFEVVHNGILTFDLATLRDKAVKMHLKNIMLDHSWANVLRSSLGNDLQLDIEELKIWLDYFIFRYAIKATDDGDFYSRIAAGVLSYLVIAGLPLNFIDGAQKYSKETEHNQKNMSNLFAFSRKLCNVGIENY